MSLKLTNKTLDFYTQLPKGLSYIYIYIYICPSGLRYFYLLSNA